MPTKRKLTPKQTLFYKEYLVDKNATQAALRAGYSKKTAYSMGHYLLKNVEIQKRIQKGLDRQAVRIEITADKVLQELAKIAFVNPHALYDENEDFKSVADLPHNIAAAVSSVEISADGTTKLKLWNKEHALELFMRHFDLLGNKDIGGGDTFVYNDFRDKLKALGPIRIRELMQRLRDKARYSVPGDAEGAGGDGSIQLN